MKKRIVAMLVAAVLCMGVTGALAAYGRGYVDADGDGKLTVRDALACVADAKRHGTAVSAEDLAAMLDGLTK